MQNKILTLERSAQNITDTNRPNKIITPPIVVVIRADNTCGSWWFRKPFPLHPMHTFFSSNFIFNQWICVDLPFVWWIFRSLDFINVLWC